MYALLKKEISTFFSSITAYLIITVFLTIIGLYMWIFPGQTNIIDLGYSSLDTLFNIAPWVFLFLIPATTMKLFAEEKRTGTIELLLTKPLSDMQIIIAKYLAGLIIAIMALIPTIIYFINIQFFLSPQNMDIGGTIGSYIGLTLLTAIYVAIGLFASAITNNQIIAFISAVTLSFFFFIGFEYISNITVLNKISVIINYLGINTHYKTISKGVIYLQDIIYFITLIATFITLTKFVLEKRKF